jgi:hypothetical protein
MVPLVILLTSVALSVKYVAHRKTIGLALAIIGLLEMVGFFMFSVTLGYISYRISYLPRQIILLQGFITLSGGVVTVFYAKPKKIIKTPTEKIEIKEPISSAIHSRSSLTHLTSAQQRRRKKAAYKEDKRLN